MKRFLLFIGATWYPCGGWCDFYAPFDTLEEASSLAKSIKPDWWHVVDLQTGTIVERSKR